MVYEMTDDLADAYQRIKELEAAIKKHRDQRGDDRCWVDDQELYKMVGDEKANTALPPKEIFMENCAKFHASRQAPSYFNVTISSPKKEQQTVVVQATSEAEAAKLVQQKYEHTELRVESVKRDELVQLQQGRWCSADELAEFKRQEEELEFLSSVVKDLKKALNNYKARYNDD